MMGGVSPETCWAIKKHWNNKFCYTVASCWFFLWDSYIWFFFTHIYSTMQGSENINFTYYYYFVFGSMQLSILFYWKNLDYRVLKDGIKRNFRSKDCKKQEYGEPFHNAQQLLALYNHAICHRLNVYRTRGCEKCMQYLNRKLARKLLLRNPKLEKEVNIILSSK